MRLQDFSEEEFVVFLNTFGLNSHLEMILDSFERTQSKLRYEIERVDKFQDRLISRAISILTLTGLVTSLVILQISKTEFLTHYLIWVFPIFIFSLLITLSSIGKNKIHAIDGFYENNTSPDLKETVIASWRTCKQYDWVLKKEIEKVKSATKKASYSEVISFIFVCRFIISYYLFNFSRLPSLEFNILITFLFIILTYILYAIYFKSEIKVIKSDGTELLIS